MRVVWNKEFLETYLTCHSDKKMDILETFATGCGILNFHVNIKQFFLDETWRVLFKIKYINIDIALSIQCPVFVTYYDE